ncbi:Rhodocoxin [Frankliniella fusca]|uniref:Rhodocoxin n=1 Tax=Frankliniella fusca TaxID=407009 RepID=A0AAE1HSH4_9NEOP|nr:Rhodocoxin [Frankliniella fusca]
MGAAVTAHLETLVTEPGWQDLCATCHSYIVKLQVPPSAVINGFRFPAMPPGLRPLTEVEEHVLALRLPFQQILHLGTMGRRGQYGVRGSVINVPTQPDHTVRTVIPLLPEEDELCIVNIKRKLMHKRAYARSFVEKEKLVQWGRYLQSTPLYREHGAVFDESRLEAAEAEGDAEEPQYTDEGEVLYGQPDEPADREEMFDRLGTIQHTLLTEDRACPAPPTVPCRADPETDEVDVAPGENNTPLSGVWGRKAEELSFPGVYLGQPRTFTRPVTRYQAMRSEASGRIRHKFKRGAKDVLGRNITREQLMDKEFVSASQRRGLAMPCLLPNSAEQKLVTFLIAIFIVPEQESRPRAKPAHSKTEETQTRRRRKGQVGSKTKVKKKKSVKSESSSAEPLCYKPGEPADESLSLADVSTEVLLSGEANALLSSLEECETKGDGQFEEVETVDQTKQSEGQPVQYSDLLTAEYMTAVDMNDDNDNDKQNDNKSFYLYCDEPEFSSSSQETQPVEAVELLNIQTVVEKLSDLLSETSWITDSTSERCRLSLLSLSGNAVVERGICWRNSRAEIYINNQPLPGNSFLWGKKVSNPYDATEVAYYIWRLATVVSGTNVCCGIEDFVEYWSNDLTRGYIESEIYQGKKRFRTHTCALAVEAITRSRCCESCKSLQEIFRKRRWKSLNRKGTELSKVTNKSLSKEQLEVKAANLRDVNKSQQLKIKRLKEKIKKKMIYKDSIEIDQHIGKDFMKILRNDASKMTEIQKLFWEEQMKALSRQNNPRSMRWNPMMVQIALHLQNISPAALNYLKDAGFISMPCNRTLYDFTHFVDNKEGVQHEILSLLEKKIEPLSLSSNENYFNLVFDEIHIKSDLVRNKHGELIGYLNLNEVENTLKELESQMASAEPKKPELAKKVLVYMLQGINMNLHEVVALYSTTDLTGVQIFSRTWDLIYYLESRKMKIISLTCDGASSNKKFF